MTVGQFVILTLVFLAVIYPEWDRSRNGYADLRQEREQQDSAVLAGKARLDTLTEEAFRIGLPGVKTGLVTRESIAAKDSAWTDDWVKILNQQSTALAEEAEIDRINSYVVALLGALWIAIAWVWFGRQPETRGTR